MSLSELETLHQLCELERLAVAGNILWYYTCTKKVSPLYVFEDKRCYKRIPIFYKNKVYFVDTLS